MLRSLIYHWPIQLAVAAGAAVAAAVLTGAMLVGDSVRGSLRDLTLERLGAIESSLVPGRFVRESLADSADARPAVLLDGSALRPESGARASGITIVGADRRFLELFDLDESLFEFEGRRLFPPAVVNATLARELGLVPGDGLVLDFGRWSAIPRDMLMGDRDPEAVLGSVRLTVVRVLEDRGVGRFGLVPTQATAPLVYLPLSRLQRSLGLPDQVNALFSERTVDEAQARLTDGIVLEDMGLRLESGAGFVELTSDDYVLPPDVDAQLESLAAGWGLTLQRTQSYLAIRVVNGERQLPYALAAALDPQPERGWARLDSPDGRALEPASPSGVLLNTWAAEDLQARVGDRLRIDYFTVGAREELREESTELTVEGIVAISGLGADPTLTPEYPGIQEARNMADWDPPFPVDLNAVRPRDETYWDLHAGTPKLFVSSETGRRLWSTRFGNTTAARFGPDEGGTLPEIETLRASLLAGLPPASAGLGFAAVRQQGLDAAAGATDFSGLFVAFSFFLILSAALLVGLLFRLGVERRAGEVGLLLATGYRVARVRRRLVGEGLIVAGAGTAVGLVAGVGYAALLMRGLRTIWQPAVGSTELYLHVTPGSVAIGGVTSMLVVWLSIHLALRRLVRLPPQRLLAGGTSMARLGPARLGVRLVTVVSALVAVVSLAMALASGGDSPVLAFLSGAALLVGGLGAFAWWCRGKRRRPLAGLLAMAGRNSSWNPGRSILSVCLIAAATFVIVVVAANRAELDEDLTSRDSGAGGYALVGSSDVPLYQDLAREDDRAELGFARDDSVALEGVEVFPFRLEPGDDASCLNLYRPEKPRVLGATDAFVQRGGFGFTQHLELEDGEASPWQLLYRETEPDVVPAIGDVNSLTWILKLGLGDELVVESESGAPVRLRIVGMLAESLFQGELLISEAAFQRHFPSRGGDRYFLFDLQGAEPTGVSEALERSLAQFGFDVTSSHETIAGFKVVQNTYLSTFQVLGGLGLLLGTVGLGVVLVRNVIERRGELATLRAFGYRRGQLATLVLAENAFLLAVGLAVGTAAALAAAGPRLLGSHLPWAGLTATLGVIAAVGMIASLLAVVGAMRVPMLPALKAER